MKIFLTYASEDRSTAERINLALVARGHDVFFDRSDLPAAHEFDGAIARAIESADLLVFLVAPESVTPGRYTLTELELAERRWPHPDGRVLPVLLRSTRREAIPPYLRAVGMLEPQGDVAAEVANEVQMIARARNPGLRALRAIRTPAGMLVAFAVAIVLGAGAVWIFRKAPAPLSRYELLFSDRAERARVRAVAPTAEGFVAALSNPHELVRFSEAGQRLAEPVKLKGRPVVVRQSGDQLLVGTETPDGVVVLNTDDWKTVIDTPLDASTLPGSETLGVSLDIRSLTSFDGEVWATTGERDGKAAILHLRLGRVWSVLSGMNPGHLTENDIAHLELRTIAGQLWGVTPRLASSSLYRIYGTMNVQTFGGDVFKLISCANDLVESEDGNLLLIDCDERLLEVRPDDGFVPVSARQTLPSESGTGRWTSHILARDGAAVFVALNTEVGLPENRPAHARIARVDPDSVALLLDLPDAVVTSLAITPAKVAATIRRADGSVDAITVPRAI